MGRSQLGVTSSQRSPPNTYAVRHNATRAWVRKIRRVTNALMALNKASLPQCHLQANLKMRIMSKYILNTVPVLRVIALPICTGCKLSENQCRLRPCTLWFVGGTSDPRKAYKFCCFGVKCPGSAIDLTPQNFISRSEHKKQNSPVAIWFGLQGRYIRNPGHFGGRQSSVSCHFTGDQSNIIELADRNFTEHLCISTQENSKCQIQLPHGKLH